MGNRILTVGNVRKTIHYLKKNGIRHAYYAAKERIEEEKKSSYTYIEPKEEILAAQRAEQDRFSNLFSIVVPAYETKESFLREMIDSVIEQSYEGWELVITDAGTGNKVERIVREYQEKEKRIRYIRLEENRGISENTNAGIEAAAGDYIGLLDHDDLLTKDALYEMAAAIAQAEAQGKQPVLLYSDEDKYINNINYDKENNNKKNSNKKNNNNYDRENNNNYCKGTDSDKGISCYKDVNKKENFNLDLILSNNYICHFMVMEAEQMKKLKLRREYDGAQDYDLTLRAVSSLLDTLPPQKLADKILHIPKVLYHWRCHEQSTAENTASKTYAYEAGKAALEDFCRARGWRTEVSHSLHLGFYQLAYLPDMFTVRSDVGIIGGRILDRKNKITSGIYNEEGKKLYYGLPKEYSGGSTHRAVLMQDCAAVDIRCMRIRPALQPLFEEITGAAYQEQGNLKLADISGISCDEEGYRKLSMELGKAAAAKGYLVVWNPQISFGVAQTRRLSKKEGFR